MSYNIYDKPTDTVNKVAGNAEGSVTYSTDEFWTGKYWIDGKKIYGKVVDYGKLPSGTYRSVKHNIQDMGCVLNCYGTTLNTSGYSLGLPYIYPLNNTSSISCYATSTDVTVVTSSGRSDFTKTYIVVEYTKTT